MDASTEARILLVDDSPEILGLLGQRLKRAGYGVYLAEDGEAALDIARREHPDIVVLDVMMPKKNGWEVARALRRDPATSRAKIVMLTAIGDKVNELTSPIYGADAYLDKLNMNDVELVIAELLSEIETQI